MRKILTTLVLIISFSACFYFLNLCLTAPGAVSLIGLILSLVLFFLTVGSIPDNRQESR